MNVLKGKQQQTRSQGGCENLGARWARKGQGSTEIINYNYLQFIIRRNVKNGSDQQIKHIK